MTDSEKADLVRRAIAAYFRFADSDAVLPQPSKYSDFESHNGRDYVVLRNINGTLAVYRVRTDGILKRLRRWPSALDEW